MYGSHEPHPYPVRRSTHRNEQVRANEVQRVDVYSVSQICNSSSLWSIHVLYLVSNGDRDVRF